MTADELFSRDGAAPAPPRLLVSVRDPAEALVALDGGAAVIDLKEPAAGALGAVSPETIVAALVAVAGRRPVSATTGDHPADAVGPSLAAARVVAATGVDIVKTGLMPGPLRADIVAALGGALARSHRLVAVLFADFGYDRALLPMLAAAGFRGVILDTAAKSSGRLRDHLPLAELAAFVGEAHDLGLLAGLAGSLRQDDLAALAPLRADVLGVRGAACRGSTRTATLDRDRVAALAATLAGAEAVA